MLDSDCRACDYYEWDLEEYFCSVNAHLHLVVRASSFSGCRHPHLTLRIGYLEDPKPKSHANALRDPFHIFNLLRGLGLQVWGFWG